MNCEMHNTNWCVTSTIVSYDYVVFRISSLHQFSQSFESEAHRPKGSISLVSTILNSITFSNFSASEAAHFARISLKNKAMCHVLVARKHQNHLT